jgi:hypothetical protein
MKMKLADASRLYWDHLGGEGPAAGVGPCPALERLVQCVLGEMPGKERDEIVGHAANCTACAAALKHVLSLSTEIDRAAAKLAAYAGERQAERSEGRAVFGTRPILKPAVAVLAGVFVVAALIVSVPRLLNRTGTRGGTEARIALISPVKGESAKDGFEFKWQGLAGADAYTVEVFDNSFRLLWRSGRIVGTEARLPAEVDRQVKAGQTYYWMVTAITDGRAEVKSKLAEFSVNR